MLTKNTIPILDYDNDPSAVILPGEFEIPYPKKAAFLFLADSVDSYAAAHNAEKIDEFYTITKTFPIYKTTYHGEEICFCQAPLGAPAAVQILDHLLGSGVEQVIAAGCCGALVDIPENTFLIPTEAVRDEGTSYHYLPAAPTVKLDDAPIAAIRRMLEKHGLAARECKVWTTDAFYRETVAMVETRRAEGCEAVDMECSAMAACARFRGAEFGQLLFTADSLANVDEYDERGWGKDSFDRSVELAFDAILELGQNA